MKFWGYYFAGINNQVSLLFLDIPSELMWIMDGPIQRRLGKNAFIEAKHEKKEEEKSKIACVFFFRFSLFYNAFFCFFLILDIDCYNILFFSKQKLFSRIHDSVTTILRFFCTNIWFGFTIGGC